MRYNRETTGAELMLTYDPTPATWMWAWDSDVREDANLAASLGLIFKRHHTTADARPVHLRGGRRVRLRRLHAGPRLGRSVGGALPRGQPLRPTTRMISHIYFGTAEPNGDNERLINRFGLDSRIAWPSVALAGHVKFNDFGPYDYHRDHNLTYPAAVDGGPLLHAGQAPVVRPAADPVRRARRPTAPWIGTPTATSRTACPSRRRANCIRRVARRAEWEIRTYLHLVI